MIKVDDLIEHSKLIDENTKSEATKKGYRSDLNTFVRWCEDMEIDPFPCPPDTIRLYLVYMDKIGRKPSTIQRAVTAIRQAHLLAGYPNPINDRVRETIKGILRLRGVLQEKKSPLTIDKLERILRFIPSDFIGVRDRAILLTGWTAALRRSEIASIDLADISQQAEGLVLTIRRSKTDQDGKGLVLGLPFVDVNPDLCAARALIKWIQISQIKEGPIFRAVGKHGKGKLFGKTYKRISSKQVGRIVKKYAAKAGYNPDLFGAHSMRSGLATTLASIGTEERKIMQITGHKSLPILREYIHRGELFHEHPIIVLFSRSIQK